MATNAAPAVIFIDNVESHNGSCFYSHWAKLFPLAKRFAWWAYVLKEVRSERYEVDDNGAKTRHLNNYMIIFFLLIDQW